MKNTHSEDNCQAYQTSTGDFICNRCGYQWDRDDTAPPCKDTTAKASQYTRDKEMVKIKGLLM